MTTFTLEQPSVIELARQGNFRAIADWINTYLIPQGIYVNVKSRRRGCLQIQVECKRVPPQEYLVRFICHCLWKLNSEFIEGARIIGKMAGDPKILWEQSVKILTPAYRQKKKRSRYKRSPSIISQKVTKISRVWAETSPRFSLANLLEFKLVRSLLISGVAITAFIFGSWLSYSYIQRTRSRMITPSVTRSAVITPPSKTLIAPTLDPKRPKTVQTALESVSVIPQRVMNPGDNNVTLMFAGDVSLGDNYENKLPKDLDKTFAKIEEYRKADVAMINLENPLTQATTMRQDKPYNFKAPIESVKVLQEAGVDIVNLANNHTMDYENQGLEDTTKTLDRANIQYLGAGKNSKEARRPKIIEVKGQRIAYLAYDTADLSAADTDKSGTNFATKEKITEDIKAIRNQVEWIIINFHWGTELTNQPEQWQIDLARFSIDQGADVIVGYHPHTLQGAEIYKDRPIAYSLGNFIFGGNSRSDYDTAVLKVSLNDKKMKVEFLPVEVKKYQPQIVKGESADRVFKDIERMSNMFDNPMKSPTILSVPTKQGGNNSTDTPKLKPPVSPAKDQFNTSPFISAPDAVTPLPSASPSPQKQGRADDNSFPGYKKLSSIGNNHQINAKNNSNNVEKNRRVELPKLPANFG